VAQNNLLSGEAVINKNANLVNLSRVDWMGSWMVRVGPLLEANHPVSNWILSFDCSEITLRDEDQVWQDRIQGEMRRHQIWEYGRPAVDDNTGP
jgi:hypothetical protein